MSTTGHDGITLQGGSDHNVVAANDVIPGILVGKYFVRGVSRGNLVANNVVHNGSVGITVKGRSSANTTLKRNTATDNFGAGIYVGSPSTTVTRNVATGNGGHGIHAVAGVTDGGGNRAAGNHKRPQCVHIACMPP